MPKIVSKSIVSSSDQQGNNDNTSSSTQLHVYYCLCSEFILVIDHDLQQLPRRETDSSYVVSNAGRTFKLTVEQGETVILRREEGYEKQCRLVCPRCNLLIGYETTPERRKGPYTYILDGALTEQQGSFA
ncbi:hypothetical protein BC943DRAFT_318075 [Umbelopsis sp. AD052]|nr:hypothetical protein BC943DRAFT_318075 [Umbelopsis sp. AD052]